MIVVALSSGTSVDGIDVATADLALDGEEVTLRPVRHTEVPFSEDLRAAVLATLPPGPTSVAEVCRVDTLLGQEFAAAAATAVEQAADPSHPSGREGSGSGPAELVVSHGQTVYHWVEDGAVRGTLQLGQPAWVAEATGLPVVSDVRAGDVAAGGQGAPLASLLDAMLLAGRPEPAAAVNLGGIANVTVAGGGAEPVGYDTGPANALLDAAVRRATGGRRHVDTGGALAAAGTVHDGLLAALLDHPYYRLPPPKSTGKEVFHLGHVEDAQRAAGAEDLAAPDVLATLVELTAATVAGALEGTGATEVLLSGGGARNAVLVRRLAARCAPAHVRTGDTLGLDPAAKEAYLFALVGFLTWHGLPGTLPGCTGARHPAVAGRITPGAAPLRLPEPAPVPPTRLRIVPGPGRE